MSESPTNSCPAPNLDYQPRDPKSYHPGIGLIGCGAITQDHLTAYRDAGYQVVALCDRDLSRAKQRQIDYFPAAKVFESYTDLLAYDNVAVVDITTHPPERPPIIEAALSADKHVLSQKPFVLDLDEGLRLVELAEERSLHLAVNQNGRWAPHFSYMRAANSAGLLGELSGIHLSVHWDHSWVEGTEFAKIHHLILYDYAIHWFDMVTCLMGDRPALRVYASAVQSASQTIGPPLLGQAMIEYENGQASLSFDAHTKFGEQDRSLITGSKGTISSVGPGNKIQTLTLTTADGTCQPHLEGSWFPDGFHGTMGELLCSIEQNRRPSIDARRNLNSLALCFAAVASADHHEPVVPGTVRQIPQ
ncbi:MAG: Gfo/Idh/MocA family oxidoreductase [Pirellulaceae bacterium]|nr:Gfo/Idh/MocA family oxidoreductase [Pirellulaceae bacterium]